MDIALLQELLKQGIFTALFVALLVYVIKTTGEREKSYSNLINDVLGKQSTEIKIGNESTEKVLNNVKTIDTTLSRIDQKVDGLEKKVDGIDRKVELLSVRITDTND